MGFKIHWGNGEDNEVALWLTQIPLQEDVPPKSCKYWGYTSTTHGNSNSNGHIGSRIQCLPHSWLA